MPDTEPTIDTLTDADRAILLDALQEDFPDVAKQLLERVQDFREHQADRAAMEPHQFQRSNAPGTQLCYFRPGRAWCMRLESDPMHEDDEDPRAWQG